jgi:hypothetical protein
LISASLAAGIKPEAEIPDLQQNDQGQWKFDSSVLGLFGVRKLSVCVEPTDGDGTGEFARIAQQQVNSTWGKSAQLSFSGWQRCSAGARGVRLGLHRSVEPKAFGLGRSLDGVEFGAVVGLGDENLWMQRCKRLANQTLSDTQRTELCFRLAVTHEFGHILGLKDREAGEGDACLFVRDYPGRSKVAQAMTEADETPENLRKAGGTTVDVMTTCPDVAGRSGADAILLGKSDIDAVQQLYCRKGGCKMEPEMMEGK